MAQLFHRSFNTIAKAALVGMVLGVAGLAWGWRAFTQSDYVLRVGYPIQQPIPFSHQHHVAGLGIDCRYCHQSVAESSFAGMPPTHTCMSCHSQIWTRAPMLAPVRQSLATGQPLRWRRVYDLPDFVYFNHAIHVHKGVGCSTCHGRVDQMPLVELNQALTMKWCLECHRAPERFVRPREEVFNMEWLPPPNQLEQGRRLVREYNIQSLIDCSICHR